MVKEAVLEAPKVVFAEYIRNQLAEDKISDQMTIKEYYDPFTGEPANKSK